MTNVKDVSGAIFIRDGKLFSAKRGDSKYSYVAHKYEFVGGKREEGGLAHCWYSSGACWCIGCDPLTNRG